MTYTFSLFLASIAIILNVVAQIMFKQTAVKMPLKTFNIDTFTTYLLSSIFSITFIIGLTSAFLASILYLISLSKLPLSVAFPFTGLSFIAIFLIGIFMFNEKLSFLNISGMVLMLVGIFLITYSSA
jgi:multidrug transporter EmrE-like cation transporter|tara:strand:+ start:233 stop:613 length:381 start_codon:yes stop_codon:yes gene_type:complete